MQLDADNSAVIACNVQVHKNVLSEDDIDHILNHEVVIDTMHKMKMQNEKCNCIPFFIPMTDSIKTKLMDAFHLPALENVRLLPLRWVSGDTEEHNDIIPPNEWLEGTGVELADEHDDKFDFTHLVYLTNDANGKFVVGDDDYAIERNVGYKFCEGIKHKTVGCSSECERLILGPFTEEGICCGFLPTVNLVKKYPMMAQGGKSRKKKLAKKMRRTRRGGWGIPAIPAVKDLRTLYI